jgi:Tfp pilus assembly protein PilP
MQIRKTITRRKTMETLSLQNLSRLQTKKGRQNMKPSRKHERKKLEKFWKHILRTKMMMKMSWTNNWKQ